MVPERLAPDKFALVRLASVILSPLRLAPDRSAPDRLAFDRFDLVRSMPERLMPGQLVLRLISQPLMVCRASAVETDSMAAKMAKQLARIFMELPPHAEKNFRQFTASVRFNLLPSGKTRAK